jgi:hypothetical protein
MKLIYEKMDLITIIELLKRGYLLSAWDLKEDCEVAIYKYDGTRIVYQEVGTNKWNSSKMNGGKTLWNSRWAIKEDPGSPESESFV